MISRSFALLTALLLSISLFGQAKKTKKVPLPDIPGSFIVDFGFNRALSSPDKFKLGLIGSRTLNIYYQYPIRFGKSKFSLNPGAGFSFERFKFSNAYTIGETSVNSGVFQMVAPSTSYSVIKKSMLINNYFEIPVDFRFDTKPEDTAHSFNVSIGGRVGYLMDSFTKIKGRQNGEMRVLKDKQNHGVNPFRYGVYSRIGIGGFNVFGFYNLSPLFEKDKGPAATTMNTFTVGISINGL